MKTKCASLPRRKQEEVEAEYHQMKPADFDQAMSAAVRRSPNAIRLPRRLVNKLRTVAKAEGKGEYRTMVKAWIEERLQREVKHAR